VIGNNVLVVVRQAPLKLSFTSYVQHLLNVVM
jgi:hypothetical protein